MARVRRGRLRQNNPHPRFSSYHGSLPTSTRHKRWSASLDSRRHQGTWPRRLLYVPSVTSHEPLKSVERTGDCMYAGQSAPMYNAISYTWGRFMEPGTPHIDIRNTSWPIPSIQEEHFTCKEFADAIRVVAGTCGFVWVDIACIDQENESIKIDEIGKQAEIFRRAAKVYAWLAPLTDVDLRRTLWQLDQYCAKLDRPDQNNGYRIEGLADWTECTTESLKFSISDLRAQPWFTSLWTLQEAFLRKDAILLSRDSSIPVISYYIEGEPQDLNRPVTLNWLFEACQRVFFACLDGTDDSIKYDIYTDIKESGILSLSTMNKYTLYSASTKRQSTLPQDKIYGISQLYNISLGVENDLSVLSNEFSYHLNFQSPVFAQLFVHSKPVEDSHSWRVSQEMELPVGYILAKSSVALCQIRERPRGGASFSGSSCKLVELVDIWRTLLPIQEERATPYFVGMNIDAQVTASAQTLTLSASQSPVASQSQYSTSIVVDSLSAFLPLPLDRYKVLLLGRMDMGGDWVTKHSVGLIICQPSSGPGSSWMRAGVCSWQDESQHNLPKQIQIKTQEGDIKQTLDYPSNMWKSDQYNLT